MKIAIVKLSAMGDIIHAMVVLQYLKQHLPQLQIDWVVEKAFVQILENNPHINEILVVNLKALKKNKMALFQEIKKIRNHANNHYDLVIDAQGLLKSAITSRLLGDKVAGFSKNSTREGIASYFYHQKSVIPYQQNAIERNSKVISEPLGFTITNEDILNKKPFLYYPEKEELPLTMDNYTVFIVGASLPTKMYPQEKFLEIANALEENIVVIWANEVEHTIAKFLEKHADNVTCYPKINLKQLKKLIAKANLVIGGDTGPTHMAWALNIPSITIFGNTPEYRNTYLTPINRVVKSNSHVNPLKLDKEDFSIQEIEAQSIVTLAKELLND